MKRKRTSETSLHSTEPKDSCAKIDAHEIEVSSQVAALSDMPCGRPDVCAKAISENAYHRWQAAGSPDGDGACFWLAAERELCCGVPDFSMPVLALHTSPSEPVRNSKDREDAP